MLTPGSRLGVYEISTMLGIGGMGEVYRARDTKLNRDVALKILPEAFALDAERLARFKREAQVLASLNHPHIAQIYGFEDADGVHALVLELVDGPTLADRIAQGPIPIDEVLPIARQIAEALEAAHEQGIIHRDLKPANIKVREDGTVKVLDFGLAKLTETAGQAGAAGRAGQFALSQSPTITTPAMTLAGMILGTAAYMSPEQAKGRPADKRSDIWAFGCVLYEMLTGKRAFEGDDVSDTLAAVLRGEPDWDVVPADVPLSVRTVLQSCLEKDRRKRLSGLSAVRFVMETPELGRASGSAAIPSARRRWLTVAVSFAAVVVATAIIGTAVWSRARVTPALVVRFSVVLPEDQQFSGSGLGSVAISPDGSQIAYAANQRLYVRAMSDSTARPVPGTEGNIGSPVFSPDGQSIAFFLATGRNGDLTGGGGLRSVLPRGVIKRIGLSGGMATTVCDAEFPFGMSWSRDGILFGQLSRGAVRVAATGGEPQLLAGVKEDEIALGPQVLPSGDALLFTEVRGITRIRLDDDPARNMAVWDKSQVVVQSLKTGERRTLVDGGSDGRYVSSGHLLYAVGGTLRAAPFDLRRLALGGGAVSVVEGLARTRYAALPTGSGHMAVSDTGTLVYLPGAVSTSVSPPRDLAFYGRKGTIDQLKLPPLLYESPSISPDGKQVVVSTDDGRSANIWIDDLSGAGPPRQLTFLGRNRYPIWSSDGRRVAFQSDREGDLAIFWQAVDGRTPADRLTTPAPGDLHIPQSSSPNGRWILYSVETKTGFSLWTLAVQEKSAQPFGDVRSSTIPPAAAFSPDGASVAYQAGEVPNPQIFVQPFPSTGALYQASPYGRHPRWSPDGTQLFFTQQSRLLTVNVARQPTIQFGNPTPVLQLAAGGAITGMQTNYDLSRDGSRFITPVTAAGFAPVSTLSIRQVDVVFNWFEELKRRVPEK